jgi:hypothetical protein
MINEFLEIDDTMAIDMYDYDSIDMVAADCSNCGGINKMIELNMCSDFCTVLSDDINIKLCNGHNIEFLATLESICPHQTVCLGVKIKDPDTNKCCAVKFCKIGNLSDICTDIGVDVDMVLCDECGTGLQTFILQTAANYVFNCRPE